MKFSRYLLLSIFMFLILGCDPNRPYCMREAYDIKDLSHITVREINAPSGVQCFVLIGTKVFIGNILSCFPETKKPNEIFQTHKEVLE